MSAKFSTSELRWLLLRIRPFIGLQLAYLATLVAASFFAILDPLILKWLVDDIIPWRKSEMLLVAGGAFVLTFLLRYSLSGIGGILNFYCSERVVFNIRIEVLRHLQRLSSSFHDSTSPGELMHRIEQDTMQIANLTSQLFTTLVRVVTTTILTLIVMLLLSWQMTLFILPLVPGVMILRRYVHPRLRQAADDAQRAAGQRTAFLQDQLAAMDQVQVLRQEASQRRRFLGLSRRVLEVKVRQQSWDIFLMLSSLLISVMAMAVALTYGGHQVLAGQLTLGGLIAFYTYVSRFFEPMQSIASLYSSLQASGASIRRIQELLAARSEVQEATDAQRLRRDIPGRVRFADITFAYGALPLLRDVSLDIEPGERLALVGESGSGKTTLLKLLVRLYDADAGRITVDEKDIRRLRLGDLRQRIALVPQAPVLFDTSLGENLRYGHRGASQADLEEVATVARLDGVIERVGWDAPVGPRGSKLSGGERQRVAIARALLSRPRVLLLDEATSALDGPGERRLFGNLVEHLDNTTLVFITHRLATVDWANRVVVMEAGEIVEEGRPRDLYRAAGPYRALCEAQQIEAPNPVPTLVSA